MAAVLPPARLIFSRQGNINEWIQYTYLYYSNLRSRRCGGLAASPPTLKVTGSLPLRRARGGEQGGRGGMAAGGGEGGGREAQCVICLNWQAPAEVGFIEGCLHWICQDCARVWAGATTNATASAAPGEGRGTEFCGGGGRRGRSFPPKNGAPSAARPSTGSCCQEIRSAACMWGGSGPGAQRNLACACPRGSLEGGGLTSPGSSRPRRRT